MTGSKIKSFYNELQAIQTLANDLRISVYIVGGAVRDLILGVEPLDVDIVIEDDVKFFAEKLVNKLNWQCGHLSPFMTIKLYNDEQELDLVRARTEIYPKAGALPVVSPATLLLDLKRRDFSVNAMALKLDDFLQSNSNQIFNNLIDPYSGVSDLRSKTIRTLHSKSFIDDPTRMFRAIRYMCRLDGKLAPETKKNFKEALNIGVLETISKKRILTEIKKILSERSSIACMEKLSQLGVIKALNLVAEDKYLTLEQALTAGKSFAYFIAILYSLQSSTEVKSFFARFQISKKEVKNYLVQNGYHF